ncbi:hypothetical protein NDI76_11480 [Halogeometricum sp. S1BR25-6]|uniref:Protein kinase domain-containing protein n=1 Tax=Halogeometricum salsisoli TaxID=2950536 RepID=A0ABU2GGY4_9EURY|nr:hypothetical protein [Halogeometricum sp. S1BR25-6]MDS0299363.1 hypothetical protein [Halogeometricum sp. S1BR25-6]
MSRSGLGVRDTSTISTSKMKSHFEDEREFSQWLSDRLDGATVIRSVIDPTTGDRTGFTLKTTHQSGVARNDTERPDIEMFHNIDFDHTWSQREEYAYPPTNPVYIECKIGDAFRERGEQVADRSDTGIPAIQRALPGQLRDYQNGDSKSLTGAGPDSDIKWTVLVTCPFMLDGVLSEKAISGFSLEQFKQTLRALSLGWVYRHEHGIVLQMDALNSYLVLD